MPLKLLKTLLPLVIVVGLVPAQSVQAQGSAQVVVSGVPGVLPSPFRSALERNYRQGRYTVQFTYTGQGEAAFRFRVTLERNGRQIVQATSSPTRYQPGTYTYRTFDDQPEIDFPSSSQDLIDQLPSDVRRSVVQAGVLPEGDYLLRVEPLPQDPNIAATPSMTPVQVAFPEPPVLATPSDGATVTTPVPTFTWTPPSGAPAAAQFQYKVLLVEMLPNQTPLQAIQANRAHYENTFRSATSFSYTPDLLPLEEGKRYAWQVTADGTLSGQELPFTNEGESEIYTFRYGSEGRGGDEQPASEIVIEPGLARLVSLDRLQSSQNGQMMNGPATLRLSLDTPVELPVNVRNLRVARGQGTPTATGGRLEGRLEQGTIQLSGSASEAVTLDEIAWQAGSGFQAKGKMQLPDGQTVEAEGKVRLSQNGLAGSLEATGDPLFEMGDEAARLAINRVKATFPSGDVFARGALSAFGDETGCTVNRLLLFAPNRPTQVTCSADEPLPLVNDSDRLTLTLGDLDGTLSISGQPARLDYDLNATANLDLQTPENGSRCGLIAPLQLSSGNSVTVGETTPTCPRRAELDLGLVRLGVTDLSADRLAYQGGAWDVALSFDAALSLPPFGLDLPTMQDITLDKTGLTFPKTTFAQTLQAGSPEDRTFDVAGYEVTVNSINLPRTTFPWYSWDGKGPGPWELSFDVGVGFPDESRAPSCLRSADIQATGFQFKNGTLGGKLELSNLGDCRWALGGGYALAINSLDGRLTGKEVTDTGFTGASEVTLDADLELGEPFRCDEQTPGAVSLPSDGLTLRGRGLEGTVPNVLPQCPVGVGPFTAGLTQSELVFEYAQASGQTATLDANATLQLPDGQGADGTVGVNLMTGDLTALNFKLRDPFRWDVPQDNPALSFRIQRAEIGLDGFAVNGRQELLLGNGNTLGATFDNLLLGLESMEIERGEVLFDGSFDLAAGIDAQTKNITFEAVPTDHTLSRSPGAQLELAGQVKMDSSGLHAKGSAAAALRYDRWGPQNAFGVEFSQDFLMGLYPFKVKRGQADLTHEGNRIAYIDPTGFHPAGGLVAGAIPDRLPLPTEQTAYLQLKKNGQPVVTTTDTLNGKLKLETRPGESVDLVIPALSSVNGTPNPNGTPALSASFTDLIVDPSGGSGYAYHEGRITATVSGAPLDLSALGIPVQLREVLYGTAQAIQAGQQQAQQAKGLFLKGNLTLFEQDLGTSGEVMLAVNRQRVVGSFDLPGLNESVELGGGAGQLALAADSAGGTVDVPFQGAPTTNFDVNGAIALNDAGGSELARADLGLAFSPQGVSVTRFSPSARSDTAMLDLGAVQFGITGINGLSSFSYDEATGDFDFRLDLDFLFAMETTGGKTFEVPLKQVHLSPQGFELPAQQINGGTSPSLPDTQRVQIGPVKLGLYDVNLAQDVTVDWLANPGQAVDALAGLQASLSVDLPNYPSIEDEITLANAGFDGGLFTGQLTALTYQDGIEPRIGLGGDVGLYVSKLSGALTNDGGQQGFDINFAGEFELPSSFGPAQQSNCQRTSVTFNLSSSGGLEGTVSDFAACASFSYGPATLTFPTSDLELAADAQGAQTAILDAQADASISGANGEVTGSGAFEIDLTNGDILNANIALNGAFDYGLPSADPVFTLRVQQATIEQDGFLIDGSGSFMPGGVDAGVQFDKFKVDPLAPEIVSGSATIQSGFALETQLSGNVSWQVKSAGSSVSGGSVLRMDFPTSLKIDRQGLLVNGSTAASLNYEGNTYASLGANFKDFRLGVEPFGVKGGRVEFMDNNTRVAYYDTGGFHFDAGGVAIAVLPKKIPLPSKDVAYLKIKDDQGNALVTYNEISGGYRLNSMTDDQGTPQPVELVMPAVQNGPDTLSAQITLSDLDVNDSFQQVMGGSINASTNLDLEELYDVPLRLTNIHYQKDGAGYALTVDGNTSLPEGFGGGQDVTFSDVGVTSNGLSGTFTAGSTPFVGQCSSLSGNYQPQAPLASVAYTGGQLKNKPSSQELNQADLGLSLHAVKFELNPSGSNTFAVLGGAQSRLTADPTKQNADPDQLPFIAGYTSGTWGADLCTNPLPDDQQGDDKINLRVANLYLDSNNGGAASLEIDTNTGDVDLMLSGTLTMPALGGEFGATVQDLRLGTSGVSVKQAGGATQNQEFTLFDGDVRARNDKLTFAWNTDKDAFVLTLDGTLWVVPYMCTEQQNGPTTCDPSDAATFNGLTADTRGNVGLGSASIDLLGARDSIAVIGSEQNPNLTVNELTLEKRQNKNALALGIGGQASPPDIMEGSASNYSFRVFSDGTIEGGPINFEFGSKKDKIDGIKTEVTLGDFATMDVKEIGLNFENDDLAHTALFANGSAYVKNDVNNVVRFGGVGQNTAGSAGLYYPVGKKPSFNVDVQATVPDIDFKFFKIQNLGIGTTTTAGGFGITLAGDFTLSAPGVSSVSAQWKDLTFNRTGLADPGGLGPNGVTLDIIEIATLEVGTVDFSPNGGTVTIDGEDVDTRRHFAFGGASLSLKKIQLGGGIGGAYYVEGTDGSLRLAVEDARLQIPTLTATVSFNYQKNAQGSFAFLARGGMDLDGLGEVDLTGAFANVNNEIAFGLAVKLQSDTGIDVIPRILTVQGVAGGFYYNPTVAMMEPALGDCEKAGSDDSVLPAFNSVPQKYRFDHCTSSEVKQIDAAVMLGAQAAVVDAGVTSMLQAQAMITFTTGSGEQAIELAVEGKYLEMPQLTGAVALNLKVGNNSSEANGYAGVKANYKPAAYADLSLSFSAVNNKGSSMVWAVKGNADIKVALGLLNADGEFLLCNDGMYTKVAVASGFDIWVIAINTSMELEAWTVTGTSNFGAYFGMGVNAKLFGGLAELGAEASGAYINRDKLFYATARGYVKAGCVFGKCVYKGDITIWMSIKGGEGFDGGTGSNARYADMVDDAREEAKNMQEEADEAQKSLDEAKENIESDPFKFTDVQIQTAGIKLIGAKAGERSNWASEMMNNEGNVGKPPSAMSLLQDLRNDVITGPRTSTSTSLRELRQEIDIQEAALQFAADAVSGHLGDLTAKAIKWNAEAAKLSREITSPVSSASMGAYSGSGKNKQLVSEPSFSVDTVQAQQQEQALEDVKDEIEKLDKRYRQSINAVTKNLNKLSAIMSGQTMIADLGIFELKFSANAVAKGYAKLIAKKQRFFAMRADSLWQTRSWAQNQRGKFQSGGDYSSSEITSAMNGMAGRLGNQQQKMANVAAERQRLVLDLGNDPNLSASHESYTDKVNGYVNDGNISALEAPETDLEALETEFVNMGRYLWHDVPKAGLSAYADTMRLRAEANGAPMNRELDPTLANWESFTHSIDTLYAIKADMATTLYGMMETYLAFREDAYQNPQQDDTLKTYRQRAQNLLVKMRPPRLGGLFVTRSGDGSYKSQTKIKYVAWHDEGIAEASANWVEGSTSTSAYSPGGSFYTIGDRSNMKLWTFKETAGEQTKDLSVAMRVRGPTGATQTRRMATTLTVDPDGPSSGRGLEVGAADDDTSPFADASLPAYEEADVGEGSAGTGGLQVDISGFDESQGDSYTEAAWTNDPSQIRFHITAYDSQSDIYGHEYALGSSKGGTDVRDWTEAAGRRTNAGENRGAGANAYFKGITRGMSLEPNTPYYVSVRTENGEGLTTTDKVGVPLVYDDTAPSAPRRTAAPEAMSASNVVMRYSHRSTAPPRRPGPLERMAPPYDGPAQNTSDGNKPSATVSWKKARDKQSGIKEYQYVVVNTGSGMDLSNVATDIDDLVGTANAEDVFADESRVQTTTNTQISLDGDDGLSFFGPSHVYVRAVNHAGTPGEMLHLGPIEPADHSVPNPAHIRIMTMPDGIRVYLKRPASDPETKIEGYRYRVKRLDDGSVVRDYPDSGFDFDPQCDQKSSSNGGGSISSNGPPYYQMNQSFETRPPGYDATGCANTYTGSSAPYLFIPEGNLPHGKKLVINLKAFNYDGDTKETTTRGLYGQASTFIMLDDTAPPEPNITSHSFDGNNVTINVDEVKDPESGIVKVEYAVRNNNNQNTRRRITWGELAPISGGPQTGSQDYSGTKDYTMNAPYMTGDPNEVGIRVTNGRGQQTVVWTDALQLNAPPGDYSDTEFTGL